MTLKLVSAIASNSRSITVDGPGDRPMPFLAQIDEELVLVTGGAARIDATPYPDPTSYLWNVERGANGTIAAAHTADAEVVPVAAIVTTTAPAVPPSDAGVPGTDLTPATWDGNTLHGEDAGPTGPYSGGLTITTPTTTGADVSILGGYGADENGAAPGGQVVAGGADGFGAGNGGLVSITSGFGGEDSDGRGGDVIVTLGRGDGTGRDGQLVLAALPVEDPEVAHAVFTVADALDALKIATPGSASAEDVATALNALIDALANTLQLSAG